MITPSYAATATERVLPRLALDFTTAVTDPRVTTTRALNTATCVNAAGFIDTVNANLPRYDFDPITKICRGQLIEETRANLLVNSVFAGGGAAPTSFTQPVATGSSAPITSTNSLIGVAYSQSSTAQRPFIAQSVSLTNATQYAISMVIEATSGVPNNGILGVSGFTITQYFVNGVAVSASAASVPGVLSAVFTNNIGTASYSCRYGLGVVTTVTGTLRFSCPQIEAGAFATSYIPTTTTALTRNADVAVMTGTNFSSWWTATTGSMLVCAQQKTVGGIRPWTQFDDNTTNNIIVLRGNTTNPELYIKATTDQTQIDAGTIAVNTSYGLTGAWNTNNCAAAINGALPVTDTSATIPTVTQSRLGCDGTNYLNGWLAKIMYWPQRITDAEVQAFSKQS